MDRMIPFESIFMKAMDQSNAIDSNVQVPFKPEPAITNPGENGRGGRYYVPGSGSYQSPSGFSLEGPVGYVPDGMRIPEKTYDMDVAASVPAVEQPSEPPAMQQGGVDEQQRAIEQVAQYGDIPQLLAALKAMASMEPGQQGNPVFQLDDIYKKSSALGGIPGTVAQYPKAGGMTRETEYFF